MKTNITYEIKTDPNGNQRLGNAGRRHLRSIAISVADGDREHAERIVKTTEANLLRMAQQYKERHPE